jgi:hypothetical protein
MERLSLSKERDILVSQEQEIINPRVYLHCVNRLDAIRSRLNSLSWEIPRLTSQLHAEIISTGHNLSFCDTEQLKAKEDQQPPKQQNNN